MFNLVTPQLAELLLRVALGVIFIVHGIPKLKNVKPGFKVLGILESLAGLAIILGLFMEWAGLIIIIVMLGAIYHKIFKWKTPFSTMTSGWEFDLIILVSALILISLAAQSY